MPFFDPAGYQSAPDNPIWLASTGVNATAIEAGKTDDTIISDTPAVYFGILVTEVGSGVPLVYDNASSAAGTIVGVVPASAPLGLVSSVGQGVRCMDGITIDGDASNPAMTVLWYPSTS